VKKMKAGRQLTPAGQSFMDNLSHQVKLEVQKSIPELERY